MFDSGAGRTYAGSSPMQLSEEQQKVLDAVMRGRNILITGCGGTGKSFLLKHLLDELDMENIPYGCCGSTGVAAVNVGGTTLHSWLGIGLGEGQPSALANNIRNNQGAFNRIRKSRVLIVDEISMTGGLLLTKINRVLQLLRASELPFGGLQMVFVGDFLQLPPVNDVFAFESPAWKAAEVQVHVLTKVFRQEDAAFARALGQLRLGSLDQESKDFFNARARAKDPNPEILPVAITAKNATADTINNRNLSMLPGDEKRYLALDTGTPSGLKLLDKGTIPKELSLKVGARVMCLVNHSPEDQVMNGTTGVVIEFTYAGYPVVRFDNGVELFFEPISRELTSDGAVIATRKQIPLRLSWAVSTHKIQGSTLSKVEAHLGEAWEPGQTYVCFSRVRTPEGLFIKSINPANICSNPKALEFYLTSTSAE